MNELRRLPRSALLVPVWLSLCVSAAPGQQPRCFFLECAPGESTPAVPQTSVTPGPDSPGAAALHRARPRVRNEVCEQTAGFNYCVSSVLAPQHGFHYRPTNMTDGRLDTAWVEGQPGDGIGEWVVVDLGRERRLFGFEIMNGYHKNSDIFKKNNRVREIEMVLSTGFAQTITLKDASGPQRVVVGKGGVPATWAQFKIKSIYSGTKYRDTAITELTVLTTD